ncbi:hypothetical protein ABZ616_18625 [Streptomyces noursei]|uniref:hypothetical protein n=1 Tax=Streptomyces noursei TaxID=1971 RepID=UPI0033F02570
MTKRIPQAILAALACALMAGCSGMNENNLKFRDIEQVKGDVRKASSELLGIIGLKGKATEGGPLIAPCSNYPEGVYRASHPWSVYGIPVEEMEKAMDRLRTGLPKNGWKIVKDGKDRSPSKSPQIVANSKGDEFSVDIRLHDERKYGSDPSLIEVTVESACFKTKQPD